ncbi:MAG: type II secretion system protein GspG [Gammaproteobacteria bacterium TMED119]|nr:MAG: type II secretion system protein GspG [Gammaproteobacteria bacterium TMED119]RCL44423.1 MAG: type II secretion system protein GspG [Candidatus Thioglobus sp.]|tara:strand:- start:2021 stop:2446 length:426 start_codon:yes stop_codon:yes gene_type:complete
MHKHTGFTLIEVIVVLVILGILASIVVPNVISRTDQAQIVKAKQDLRALESALQLYRVDNFKYPTTDQGLQALVERPTIPPQAKNWQKGGYIKKLPQDPWLNAYQYLSPGQHGDFDLYTLGADGRPGGSDENQDIGNWTLE